MLDHLQQAEVLARSLGDRHRLGRIATLMVHPRRVTGDYDAALKCGQEALAIARTLGDRSIEVVATNYLGDTHVARGEFSEAAKLLERNIGLDGKLRAERFGTFVIQSALSEYLLAIALSASAGSTRASDMPKPQCGSARRPIIHTRCSSGC
jgi:hypothetical protein